jgi:antitoxin component YwqK of YwqJK toxin-antitoxin module
LVDGGTAQGSFDHGVRSGEWLFQDQRGNLIKQVEFSGGALNSSYREWSPDGTLKTEGQFLVGQRWGTWRSWSANGSVSEIRYHVP